MRRMKTFYLVDGHAHIFRAYYAPFGSVLNAPSGEPTKATYVFTQMILNILKDQKPDYFAVTLDAGDETTERREFFPEYKANREAAPDDFGPQVTRIMEILDLLDIPTFMVRGHEADDLIATIAKRVADEDVELRVMSKDKDLYQILTDKVVLWDPSEGLTMNPEKLADKHGYTPEQAVEIQTLTGDSTDNVPGVPGIGPKKAAALIQKYGSVDGVVEHVEELTPKMRERVAEHELFDVTRRLVTLKDDVDFPFALEALSLIHI